MTRFLLASLLFAFLPLQAEEISLDKLYFGSEVSYSGRIANVSTSKSYSNGVETVWNVVSFISKRDGRRIYLNFYLKPSDCDASSLKSGSFLSLRGVCLEQRLYAASAEQFDRGSSSFILDMRECSVASSASSAGQPEGFSCAARTISGLVPTPSAESFASSAAKASSSDDAIAIAFNEPETMKSIVTAKGSKGSGSAFIAKIDGRKTLVTNIHVVFDNDPKFISMANEELQVLEPRFAPDRDLAFYELADQEKAPPALEIEPDIAKLPADQPVLVLGNSLGAGVNTRLKGRILGVGPSTLEISAQIVPGNSGSPILNASNGKVVGVSTYGTVTRKADFSIKGTRFEEVRRFGTRTDSLDLASLEPFDKRKYAADVKLYNSVEAVNELGLLLLTDICEQKAGKSQPTIEPSRYDFKKYVSLEPAIKEWNDILNGRVSAGNKSSVNVSSGLKRFKSQISMPIMNARKQQANYSWVRDAVAKQIEQNDSYCKAFDDIRKEVEELSRK